MATNFIFKNKIWVWAGILLAQILLFYLVSKIPEAIEIATRFFEFQKNFHQKLFAPLGFSVGDVFYIALTVALLFSFLKLFSKKTITWRGILIAVNILYFSYQIFWGLLYFEPTIIEKLAKKTPENKHIQQLTLLYLEKCIADRAKVSEKNGVFAIRDFSLVKQEILASQKKIPKFLIAKNPSTTENFKPSLFGKLLSYTGISGYYNPFTAEAQYDAELPHSSLPFTLAHESAHQMGIAREEEANFAGFLIGENSGNADLRYSTDYFVLKSLLGAQVQQYPEFVKSIIQKYSPAMKRDRNYEKAFYKRHEGWADQLFALTNDLFLKSNRQDGSVTYSYFVDLLLHYQ